MATGVNIRSAWVFKKGPAAQGHDEIRKQCSLPANSYEMWSAWWFDSGTALTKDLADTLTISDSITNLLGKQFTDTLTLSDSLDKTYNLNKSDTLLTSDQISKLTEMTRGDYYYITDSFSTVLIRNLVKELSDSIRLTDNKSIGSEKKVSDSVSLSDSINKQVSKLCNDTITFLDNLLKENKKNITLSDVFNITDAVIKESGYIRTLSDSVAISDQVANIYMDRVLKMINSIYPFAYLSGNSHKHLSIKTSTRKSETVVPEVTRELIVKYSSRKNLKIISRYGL